MSQLREKKEINICVPMVTQYYMISSSRWKKPSAAFHWHVVVVEGTVHLVGNSWRCVLIKPLHTWGVHMGHRSAFMLHIDAA